MSSVSGKYEAEPPSVQSQAMSERPRPHRNIRQQGDRASRPSQRTDLKAGAQSL